MASSHSLGPGDAVPFPLALDRVPGRLIVDAVEAASLAPGTGLAPAVAASVDALAEAVMRDIQDA